jgi:hypothetical protein
MGTNNGVQRRPKPAEVLITPGLQHCKALTAAAQSGPLAAKTIPQIGKRSANRTPHSRFAPDAVTQRGFSNGCAQRNLGDGIHDCEGV